MYGICVKINSKLTWLYDMHRGDGDYITVRAYDTLEEANKYADMENKKSCNGGFFSEIFVREISKEEYEREKRLKSTRMKNNECINKSNKNKVKDSENKSGDTLYILNF